MAYFDGFSTAETLNCFGLFQFVEFVHCEIKHDLSRDVETSVVQRFWHLDVSGRIVSEAYMRMQLLPLDRYCTNFNGLKTPVHGYSTSADDRRFFKDVGDQIVARADETITW